MGLTKKIVAALRSQLHAEYCRLDDDDGISGFVVAPTFEGHSTWDRQKMIDDALRHAPDPLSPDEHRQVLMIAGLTPAEYESAGARTRVHKIEELDDGSLKILLHGGYSDAKNVRGALNNETGVKTTEPEQCPGAVGILMQFRATGTRDNPLTKEKAHRILSSDQYIIVMPGA